MILSATHFLIVSQPVQIIDLMLEEAALCSADPSTVYQLELLVPQVGCRSVSQNSCSSRTNGLQPSQPLTQSEAEAINDNLQNEQVSIYLGNSEENESLFLLQRHVIVTFKNKNNFCKNMNLFFLKWFVCFFAIIL